MVLEGLTAVLQPLTIALVALGTIVGIIFGSIPGLTATMAVVMFLPVTYSVCHQAHVFDPQLADDAGPDAVIAFVDAESQPQVDVCSWAL